MTREDDYVPVGVKRAVGFHSNGRCQYRNCEKLVVIVDPVSGAVKELGRYAHILPVGGAARAEYKAQHPDLDLNSFKNIMLLCSDHHDLVDKLEVPKHPPEILFRMKYEKSNLIQDNTTEELQWQAAIELDLEDYVKQYQVSAILEQFRTSRAAGPRHGLSTFKEAERTMRGLLTNPFFKKGETAEVLLSTECHFTRLFPVTNGRRGSMHISTRPASFG
jgi:hypothetical protein